MKLDENKKFILALNMIENINTKFILNILKKSKNLKEIFEKPENFQNLEDEEKKYIKKLNSKLENLSKAVETEIEEIEIDKNLKVVTILDEDYPELLKEIENPPVVLYLKGDKEVLASPKISIVGSRFCTEYGSKIAKALAFELASMGFVIVSGLALGIDSFAHSGAIKAKGKTIAVLGSGLYYIYPEENKGLYNEIIKNGAVISEFPLKTKPERYNFPKRNRIISGISLGTIVVEAGMRSGALITASYAIEQNRELFAVPGPINSESSKGTNRLIKEGAKLVQTVDDIIQELNITQLNLSKNLKEEPEQKEELSEEEKIVLDCIDYEPKYVEEIIKKSKLKANIVERTLMTLEIKGYVQQLPGHRFVLTE